MLMGPMQWQGLTKMLLIVFVQEVVLFFVVPHISIEVYYNHEKVFQTYSLIITSP